MVMKKIKILHFIPLFNTGGTEKVVFDIHNGLDPSRFESHICSFFPGAYDRFFADKQNLRHVLVQNDSISARTPREKFINMFSRLNQLRLVISKTGVHLVHTHHLGPLLHVWLMRKLTCRYLPWIHTEHNVPDLVKGYSSRVFQCVKPLSHPRYVTGVSPNVCAHLQNECGVSSDRIRLIVNGVDCVRFSLANGREKIRTELGLALDDEVVGCIGNLRQEKNQRLVIKAVSLLHRKRPRLKLIFCGDGDCRADLERLAVSCGISKITYFLGHRFDIPQILSALDLFCLPSYYEGMPLSILEAWAANKPVIATDAIGIRELIVNGETGILLPPDQPHAMANAIDRMLSNPREMLLMAANGRNIVAEKYSLQAMVAQYANLYENLVRITSDRNNQ
jgi:glycosyltransferase involved in cell wall biosynthesis